MVGHPEPAEYWKEQLAAWALPEKLLASVDRSPYSWPAGAFARMARTRPDPVTGPLVRSLLGAAGSLLDVGAGAGRLCLPIAAAGHRVTAVEPNEAMADQLAQLADETLAPLRLVRGRWPAVAGEAGSHDVVASANVVYDVADIAPFIEGLHRMAGQAVVIEATHRHPWNGLRPYYRALHGVELPAGPTVDDLVRVIMDVAGAEPQRQDWPSPPSLTFESREALLDLYRTRLCVTADRVDELERLIAGDIESAADASVALRTGSSGMTTLWWTTTSGGS